MAKVQIACVSCRRRKIRCDGGDPCNNCKIRAIAIECEYKENTPAGILSRGSACIPCRQRKKKCDARKPSCSRCTNPDWCLYDDDGQWIPSTTTSTREDRSPVTRSSLLSADDHNQSSPTIITRSPSPSSSVDAIIFAEPSTLVFQHQILSPRNSVGRYSEIFFDHRLQLGLSFSDVKAEAIKSGDLSSQVIHPSLVYIAHMWGSVFWQRANSQREDEEIGFFKLALESFNSQSCRPLKAIEAVQARFLLAAYCFLKGDLDRGRQLFIGAGHVVTDHQLHMSALDLSTDTRLDREQMQAICYLLLADHSSFLPFVLEPELSAQLVRELESIATICPDVDACIMRTAATVLYHRACEHANESPADNQLSAWFDRQYHLLTQIYRYIGIIELCLLRMSFKTAASVDALGLKQCIIILLAGQITLSAPLFGWHGESARKSYLAALQIVDISSTFVSDEFYLLYSIVVFGWKLAADILTSVQRGSIQIGPSSDAQSQMLSEKLNTLRECNDTFLQTTPFPRDD